MDPFVRNLDLLRSSGKLQWTIPGDIIMKGIPVGKEEPIIDFVQVIEGPQKEIALDHAKKVRGVNVSSLMNECFRNAYNDNARYYFPDFVINSGLSREDFKTPFIINVKEIHQSRGSGGSEADALNELEQLKKTQKDRVGENANKIKSVSAVKAKTKKVENAKETILQQRKARKQSHGIMRPHSSTGGTPVKSNNDCKRLKLTLKKTTTAEELKSKQAAVQAPVSPTATKAPTVPEAKPSIKSHNLVAKMRTAGIQNRSVASVSNPEAFAPKYRLDEVSASQPIRRTIPVAIRPKPSTAPPKVSFAKPCQTTKALPTSSSSSPQVKAVSPSSSLSPGVSIVYEKFMSRLPFGPSAPGKVGTGVELLGCRDCGKTYSMATDTLFRSHVIIKHDKELTDGQVLESTILVSQFYKCLKCSVVLLNNLDKHKKICCPDVEVQDAFSPASLPGGMKLKCGLCSWAVDSRVYLAAHLKVDHPELAHKVILHPYFRCAICLRIFLESAELITHASTCTATKSSPQTMLELAKKNMECEICEMPHNKIRETLGCYQSRTLLRCILCLNVYKIRKNFFNHLQTCHGLGLSGLKCLFCDNGQMKTREMFDHIIDNHFSEAIRMEGEAAIEAGRLILKAKAHQEAMKRSIKLSSVPVPAKKPNLQPQQIVLSTNHLSKNPPFRTTVKFTPKASISSTPLLSSLVASKLPQSGVQVPISSMLQFTNPVPRNGPTNAAPSMSTLGQPCLVQCLPEGLSITPFKCKLVQPAQNPPRTYTAAAASSPKAANKSIPKNIIE